MKQVKSYRLSKENSEWLTSMGGDIDRSASWYLDDLLTRCRQKLAGKQKAKPPAVVDTFPYPNDLNVPAWEEWKAYRKELRIKAYKPTARSEGVAIKNLLKLAGGDYNTQALIIQQSIANNYQGLFALRGQDANQQGFNGQGSKPTKDEQYNNELLEKYGHTSAPSRQCNPEPFNTGLDQHQVSGGVQQQVGQEGITIDMDSGDIDFNY